MMNKHRSIIYSRRDKILDNQNMHEDIKEMVQNQISALVQSEFTKQSQKDNFDVKEILQTRTPEQLRAVLDTAKSDYDIKDNNNIQKQQAKENAKSVLSVTQNTLKEVANNLNNVLATKELTQQAELNLKESQKELEKNTEIQEQAQINYDNLSADIKVKQQAVEVEKKN